MTDSVPAAPMWKKIIDFPLVALAIAAAVMWLTILLLGEINDLTEPMVSKPVHQLMGAVITILTSYAVYKLIIRRLGERKHDDLQTANLVRDLGLGVGSGFIIMAVVVGIAAALDVYNIIGQGGFDDFVYIFTGGGLIAGFMEELIFRGILFRWIEEFAGSWAALLLTSALFGFAHLGNPNATTFSSFCIAVEAGLLLGGAYMITRSLWLPIGLHFGWNVTQGFIFDVPVSGIDVDGIVVAKLSGPELLSGGPFGLEASAIALVVAGGAGVWLVWKAREKGEIMAPWWVRRKAAQLPAT